MASTNHNHNNRVSILIVDDHEVVRNGIRSYLETLTEFNVVGEAASGEEALKLVSEHIPDIVLLDLIMPGMDGVEVTRRVKNISPRTQVIVVTSYHEDEHIFPAMRAGALSYVLKDIDPDDLAEAIRRANAGEAVINPRVATRLVKELQGRREEAVNAFSELTDREMEVLRQIAAGKSNHEIAAELVISEKTVKSHITNILNKLNVNNSAELIAYAVKYGIVD